MRPDAAPDGALDGMLRRALAAFQGERAPSPLSRAMHYALFPGGARLRPSLALAVAGAAPEGPARAAAGACALELLHSASLVHDDLPCFDDAATRRHKPSVHRAFGEATAVLVGDALLALCFRVVGDLAPEGSPQVQRLLAEAATALMHGQAQEQAVPGPLAAYHQAKTGCLFEAAARVGAVAAGLDEAGYAAFGRRLGGTYQLADDLLDVQGAADAGKDGARDAALGRPNFALRHGVVAARRALQERAAALASDLEALTAPRPARAWLAAFVKRLTAVATPPRPTALASAPRAAAVGRPATPAAGRAARAGGLGLATQLEPVR